MISILHLAEGTKFRLVSEPAEEYPSAVLVQADLEDGYVSLMKSAGQQVDVMKLRRLFYNYLLYGNPVQVKMSALPALTGLYELAKKMVEIRLFC